MTFLLFLLISTSAPSMAGEATEQIKETSDKIIAILSDPALKKPEKAQERERLLRATVDKRFDWEEMSRRTLARHWSRRTDKEKKEFIDLFGKFLERTYMHKVDDYSGEKVVYGGEKIEGNYGIVKIKIVGHNEREIPALYRVKKKGKKWYVYDVSVEGVSLINNYRTQFNSIIVRSSYDKLVQKLKAKLAKK